MVAYFVLKSALLLNCCTFVCCLGQVLTEILDSLQIGTYVVKLNHRKLLDAMMAACGSLTDTILFVIIAE